MSKIKGITPEQERISRVNKQLRWKEIFPEGNGKAIEGCCLHHKDETLRHTDIDRYIEWRAEDVEVMTMDEHSKHHGLKRAEINPRWVYEGKTEDELKEIADKKRETWLKHAEKNLESCRKHGRKQCGENNPMYGKPCTYKMSEEEYESWKKKVGQACVGKLFWNNGVINKRASECPGEGWTQGRLQHMSDETRKRISERTTACHWWNNGIQERFLKDCPDGWSKGRLKKHK